MFFARSTLLTGASVGLAVVSASLLLAPSEARASNGAFPIATSARAAGRGGTDIAIGDDAFAIVTNPAGMTNAFGYRFDIMMNVRFTQVAYNNDFNNDEVDDDLPGFVPALAVVYDFGVPDVIDRDAIEYDVAEGALIDDIPWSEYEEEYPFDIGVAIHGVTGSSGNATYRSPIFPEGESERSNFTILGMSIGASVRVNPRISFGLAITPMYVTLDQSGLASVSEGGTNGLVRNFVGNQVDAADEFFLVNGEQVTWGEVLAVAGADDSFASSRIDIDDASGFGISAVFGVMINATDWLTIGLAYRTPGIFSDIEGEATVDSSRAVAKDEGLLDQIQANFLDNHLPDDGANLSGDYDFTLSGLALPMSVALGIALRPHERFLITAEVKWVNWSAAFDEFDITLSGGSGADLNEITGSNEIKTVQVWKWDDQLVFAGGAALSVTDWLTFRIGYNYAKNQIPENTLSPFTSATAEHHATLGVGLRFGSFSLDFAYVRGFVSSSTIKNSISNAEFELTRHKTDSNLFWIGFGIDY